ncbi:MAG: F0F1 ATP synthase subunit alpha, partial [Clostridiales bacterium]|nr:F0F1 ATP synthase subunit alpha [Clostridiales bacterium]
MTNNEETRTARLYSAKAPEKADSDRFVAFLRRKYGEGVELEWVEDRTMRNGFRLEVGTHVYDWSEKGLFKQFDAYLNKLRRTETASQPVIPLIAEALKDWTPAALAEETGEVISVADGIAMVSGLENAAYGEI